MYSLSLLAALVPLGVNSDGRIVADTSNDTFQPFPSIVDCASQSGATAGAQIANCLSAIQSSAASGGVADARGITTNLTIAQNMWSGITKPIQLLLGGTAFTMSVTQTPPTGTHIVGAGLDMTVIALSGNSTDGFRFGSTVNRTKISALTITGTGSNSTSACVRYVESFDNVIDWLKVSRCNRGVLYEDSVTSAGPSSFSNTISNSIISGAKGADAINVDLKANSNGFSGYNLTIGGDSSKIGMKVVDSDNVSVYTYNCEGASVACVDIDASSANTLYVGYLLSGGHFEGNFTSGGDIRLGNTNPVNGVTVVAHDFHGDTSSLTPINAVRVNHLTMIGNVVTSGYGNGTSNDPILGTVTNVNSVGNRWNLSTGFFTYHSSNVKIGGGVTTAPSAPLEVQSTGACCITSARDATTTDTGADYTFRQKDAAGTWVDYAFVRGNLSSNTAGQVSARIIGSIRVSGTHTEIFNYSSAVLDYFRDIRTTGFLATTGKTFANLGTPPNGYMVFCSDCTVSNPCAGSGTGALAKRLNGTWVCN